MSEHVHVTPKMVEEYIDRVEYQQVTDRTTICIITTIDNIEVIGISQRQPTTPHNEEVGNSSARTDAFNKLYPFAILHYNLTQ